jgi:hypothetical protein
MTKMHFGTVYGLCHHMVRSRATKSGFAPGIDYLRRDFRRSLRLAGFAALLKGGYADILLLLGTTTKGVHSAEAMARYLTLDLGVPKASIVADIHDYGDTQTSLKAVQKYPVICTSFSHIPRVSLMSLDTGHTYIPAEAALIATDQKFPTGNHEYFMELQGIADMLNGVYRRAG